MTVKYIVNVEVAIWRAGRYLLGRRGAGESHAAGTLALVGGKVEVVANELDVLEATARREVREEVDLELDGQLHYVHSSVFLAGGTPVVDVVFFSKLTAGQPRAVDPEEMAELLWLTPDEIDAHIDAPSWTRASVARAERVRAGLGDRPN